MKNYKLLVTGAGGFLAARLIEFYKTNYEVIGLNHRQLDFTKEEEVMRCFDRQPPDVVIHCGAISDIAACEKDISYSEKVNVDGAVYIAKACKKYSTRLILCSSDQVYLGSSEDRPHMEEEQVQPPHIYGKQKYKAEQLCLEMNENTAALRLSWMYDWHKMSENEHGSLVSNIKNALLTGDELSYPINDFRSITNVWEVIKNMKKMFTVLPGIYNFGSPNDESTYTVAKCMMEKWNEETEKLHPKEAAFPGKSRNLRMDQSKINQAGIIFMDTCKGIRQSKQGDTP